MTLSGDRHGASNKGKQSLRARVYEVIEMGRLGNTLGAFIDGGLIALILANVVAVALQTVPTLAESYGPWFRGFEILSISIFSLEYLLRLWVSPEASAEHSDTKARLRYVISPMAVIDLLAIIPFYLIAGGGDTRILRLFRLIRLFKLVRYSPGMATLARVLYIERRALMAVMVIMTGLLMVSSSAIYLAERTIQPKAFGTIPDALWWALATFSTVGYGDVVPITVSGKIVGAIVMLMGFAFYAVPIGIIASGFASEIHRQEFVVRFGLVANIPLFEGLSAETLADLAELLHSRVVDRGKLIIRRGDPADSLFFLLQGRAEARMEGRRMTIEAGEFFGERALLVGKAWRTSVLARATCHLLELDARDFQRLAPTNPDLHERVTRQIEDRLEDLVKNGDIAEAERQEILSASRALREG